MARQDKTRRDDTRQENTRHDKIWHDKKWQDNTRQDDTVDAIPTKHTQTDVGLHESEISPHKPGTNSYIALLTHNQPYSIQAFSLKCLLTPTNPRNTQLPKAPFGVEHTLLPSWPIFFPTCTPSSPNISSTFFLLLALGTPLPPPQLYNQFIGRWGLLNAMGLSLGGWLGLADSPVTGFPW